MPARRLTGRGLMSTLNNINKYDIANYIRDKKLVSTGLKYLPHQGMQALGTLAGMAGLGKKRKPRKKRMVGGSFGSIFSDVLGGIGGGVGQGVGNLGRGLFGRGKKKSLAKVIKV